MFVIDYGVSVIRVVCMKQWSLTLHGPTGILSQFDSQEAQFVLGTEEAPDVLSVAGEGIAPRHALVSLADGHMRVEDLAGGTLVNGHPIEGRVEVDYPASVQVGSITLVVEEKVAAVDISSAVTIPQRPAAKRSASLSTEATIVTRPRPQAVVSPRPTDLNEAETLCKYTLVREIARGGMGQIYFGEDPQLERQVAVKVKVSSISEGGEDPRFSKEAEVLAHLAHPNIVPIYNIGVDAQRRPFYSMKLVKGRTLQAVLNAIRDGDAAAVKDYPRAALLTIFRKICDAMAFAHAKGVLHRDLKPENIMVGEYGEVLVMDWGLAKVLGGEETLGGTKAPAKDTGDYGMTMEGEVMGTPQYMSPEQAEGVVAELDARSDIYSLGGILYAILTLRPPIDGTTLNEVLTKVKRGEITSMVTKRGGKGDVTVGTPAAMGVEVPEALQAVTLKAMATDRNKRYASVETFAVDIESYQNGFATSAENAGALRQLVLFIKRNKGVSAAVALFFVAAAGFTVKLAASERIALANEKRAVSEMEAARQAGAKTAIALAEASENKGDLEGMDRALKSIPDDLRDPTSRYLGRKIDACDREIFPAPNTRWVGLKEHPSDPSLVLALQSDGALCTLNPISGEVVVLWKVERKGRGLFMLAVSEDGKVAAIAFSRGTNAGEIEVFDFSSGQKLGSTLSYNYGLRELRVTGQRVLASFSSLDSTDMPCLCLDYQTGTELWKRPYFTHGRFSKTGSDVYGFNSNGVYLKVDAESGMELAQSTATVVGVDTNRRNAFVSAEDGSLLFGSTKANRLTRGKVWDSDLKFSLKLDSPVSALGFSPSTRSLACVLRAGPNSVRLEVRNSDNGDLKRIALLKGKIEALVDSLSTVCMTADAIGVLLARDSSVRFWDMRESRALYSESTAPVTWVGDGDEGLRFVRTNPEAGRKISWLVQKKDFRKKEGVGSVTNLLAVHDKLPHGGAISGRFAGDWIVWGRGGNLWGVSLGANGEKERWGANVRGNGFVIHPTKEEVWANGSLLDLKTGEKIRTVNREDWKSRELNRPESQWAVWAGDDLVVEPVEKAASSTSLNDEPRIPMLALWNVRTGELAASVEAPYASALTASPDGRSIVEGGDDKRVRIRNGRTLEVETEARVHDSELSGVAWHPSLPLLATASRDGTIRIWDRTNWNLMEEFRTGDYHEWNLQISRNGKRLLGSKVDRIRVYEPKSFQK